MKTYEDIGDMELFAGTLANIVQVAGRGGTMTTMQGEANLRRACEEAQKNSNAAILRDASFYTSSKPATRATLAGATGRSTGISFLRQVIVLFCCIILDIFFDI